jgi:hypothetical protein
VALITEGRLWSTAHVFDASGPPGDTAGLRAANARLLKLLAGRDAEIAALRVRVAEAEGLVADLREQLAELAARVGQNRRTPVSRRHRTGWASRRRSRCGRRPAACRAGRRASRA